jgi:hypothetical protein
MLIEPPNEMQSAVLCWLIVIPTSAIEGTVEHQEADLLGSKPLLAQVFTLLVQCMKRLALKHRCTSPSGEENSSSLLSLVTASGHPVEEEHDSPGWAAF